MLEPIACGRAHARHLRQHREMLGVIDPVEFGLVLSRNVELHDKEVGHDDRYSSGQAILRKTLCCRFVVCGRILGFHSPRSEASCQAGLLMISAESTSYIAR